MFSQWRKKVYATNPNSENELFPNGGMDDFELNDDKTVAMLKAWDFDRTDPIPLMFVGQVGYVMSSTSVQVSNLVKTASGFIASALKVLRKKQPKGSLTRSCKYMLCIPVSEHMSLMSETREQSARTRRVHVVGELNLSLYSTHARLVPLTLASLTCTRSLNLSLYFTHARLVPLTLASLTCTRSLNLYSPCTLLTLALFLSHLPSLAAHLLTLALASLPGSRLRSKPRALLRLSKRRRTS